MSDANDKLVEYIILGPPEVGKTSIIRRYFDNVFLNYSYNTIGVDMRQKTLQAPHKDGNIKLSMYDTAGQERYFTLVTNFIKNKECIFLCFSLASNYSFQECKKYSHMIDFIKDNKTIVFLVGTFLDMKNNTVSDAEINELVQKHNYKYIEVSSKSGEGIRELFDRSLNALMELDLFKEENKRGLNLIKPSKSMCC